MRKSFDEQLALLNKELISMGLEVDESHFYTSALATAKFVISQKPGCSAFVIGEHGLYNALHGRRRAAESGVLRLHRRGLLYRGRHVRVRGRARVRLLRLSKC